MTDFYASHNDSLNSQLAALKEKYSFDQLVIGPLRSPLTISFYEKWLAQNYHGDMTYLSTHLPYKQNPRLLDQQISSVISIAQSYFPAPYALKDQTPARTALYAQNEDYHHWLKEKLQLLIADLQTTLPNDVFLPYVDSGPVLERDMAYQNRLGWFGKNSCIIHPEHGSLFFVAEILTSHKTHDTNLEPLPDFCGKCRRCLDICPTQALIEPKVLRADRCISYLTIESKDIPPIEVREKIGDWFFGCDLCQTVCPWNEKVFRSKQVAPTASISTQHLLELNEAEQSELIRYFRFLLTASHKQIQKKHIGTPLSRAGAKGLKRNALIVIANRRLHELTPEVAALQNEELTELSEWTLQQLQRAP